MKAQNPQGGSLIAISSISGLGGVQQWYACAKKYHEDLIPISSCGHYGVRIHESSYNVVDAKLYSRIGKIQHCHKYTQRGPKRSQKARIFGESRSSR